MDPYLSWARSKQSELVAFLRELVECESPSNDPEAVERFLDLFTDRLGSIAKIRRLRSAPGFGSHLRCEFRLPGRRKTGQVLALGHSDTVYSLGTLRHMPFREENGRIWGPGVLDMKGGIAIFVFAMRALIEMQIPIGRKVVLQLNSDEEIGSPSSRPLTEEAARESVAVLVLEPGTGLDGRAKTARKGVGDYRLRVTGKAAHAGVDFSAGASAILELARQIERIATWTDLRKGITVNPGTIGGGTRSNVIAADAWADIDFRIARARDYASLDRKFQRLKPFDRRCSLQVEGGLNRPPMERSKEIAALYRKARGLAAELGISLEESSTGGGSDGNFTAALGIPTLDGIGVVGEGAHSPGESILSDRIADRVALLAKLIPAI